MSIDTSSLFSKDLYTVYANGVAYDSTKTYDTDTVFTVTMNYTSSEIPLALLFAAMQIGLSDIAAYRTQSYMEKIESNQELQTAAANAIASAEDLQDSLGTSSTTKLNTTIINACELAGITTIDGKTVNSTNTFTSDQLTMLIEDLELAQETASTTTQTDMVYAEEYLGQYNAYLTGSSSTLDDLSSALMSIAGRM